MTSPVGSRRDDKQSRRKEGAIQELANKLLNVEILEAPRKRLIRLDPRLENV